MKTLKFLSLWLIVAALFGAATPSIRARDTVAVPTRSANLELARQLNQAFVQVAEEVSPAVVVITVTQKASASSRNDSSDDEEDPLEQFRRFFHQRQQEEQQPERSIGQGSGVIIRPDGFILTNRHVVEDADKIEVRLKDGRIFKAQVRGVDAPADVAVIKIDAKNLTVAKLADSDKTRVGEFAIAIGAPFALDYTVTFGHVSAKDRSNIPIPTESDTQAAPMVDQSFIQTDANINPGNSGGPLVNIDGEVIGINTLIRGLHTGIGFAIPINMAREVADKLITDGKFTRAWLGVSIASLREDPIFRSLVPGVEDGVVVREIVKNGPASKSKLQAADVITAVDGKPVVTSQQLKDEIRGKKIGQDVTLDVYRRGGEAMKIVVRPGEWADETQVVSNTGVSPENVAPFNALGVVVRPLTRDLVRKFNLDVGSDTQGVVVTFVDKAGLAARSGIQEGDIITSIDRHATTNVRQFRDALKNVDVKKGVILHFISEGTAKFEILKDGE